MQLLATVLASASSAIVVTAADHLIAPAADGLSLIEPHVAVSPADPNHLVAGSIVAAATEDGPWYCAGFVSRDRGDSWSRHDFAIDRCIDPWVLILPDGAALFAAIEIRRDDVRGDERFRLLAYRSEDGGNRWPEAPAVLGSAYEHPILAAHEGTVYLASRRMRRVADGSPRHTVGVERSTDGGRSFEPLAELEPSNLALNATGLSVEGDRVVVTFLDFQRNVDGFDRAGMLEHPRAWALLSTDGGVSFSAPKFLSEACGMKGGFPGYPISASRGAGRIVFACVRPGFDGLVRHVSADGGETWSEPLRIDGGSPHVRTPMLAVNDDGVVAAAWYDRRSDPERACQYLYVTASVDDGASFLEPVRVSQEASCPGAGENGRVAESWPMGGDYSSLTAGPDGAFHVVWADSRSGRFELRMATFEVRSATP